MRWFKHFSVYQRDPDIQELIFEYGYEGYGVYWAVLETIAEQLTAGTTPELKLPIKSWKNAKVSDKKFLKIVDFLAKKGKIFTEIDGKTLTIKCPNLVKWRDEYTEKKDRKSG